MQDSPGLDVGDDSLDLVADLVDGLVIGLVVRVKRQVRGFLLGVIMPSPMYPLSPIWRGGGEAPSGRSMAGTASRPQRRRA